MARKIILGMSGIGTLAPGGLFTIVGNTQANPTVVTTLLPHGLVSGDSVFFASSNSNPVIDGLRVVTVLTTTTFTVPVNVNVAAGTAGTFKPALTGISINVTAAIVTAGVVHGLRTGDTVTLANTNSTPNIDGDRIVTVLTARTFSVPVATTVVGTVGQFLKKLYRSNVLDCGGAMGGAAIVVTSTIGTAPVTVTANIQGSVDGTNWFNVPYALVATPRTFVLTALTITTAAVVTYLLQETIFWRYLSVACSAATNIALDLTATYAE